MNIALIYLTYIGLSLGMTIWVGRTLHKRGRIFVLDAFNKNEEMADSVNHLLIVGFYLINFGFVSLFLRYGRPPHDVQTAFEYVSYKFGIVLVVLGGMHFFNMYNLSKMRSKAKRKQGLTDTRKGQEPPSLPGEDLRWQ